VFVGRTKCDLGVTSSAVVFVTKTKMDKPKALTVRETAKAPNIAPKMAITVRETV
jgi:hypothetical protein